jgi:hypothetical protein
MRPWQAWVAARLRKVPRAMSRRKMLSLRSAVWASNRVLMWTNCHARVISFVTFWENHRVPGRPNEQRCTLSLYTLSRLRRGVLKLIQNDTAVDGVHRHTGRSTHHVPGRRQYVFGRKTTHHGCGRTLQGDRRIQFFR